jgi:hypothetical protein
LPRISASAFGVCIGIASQEQGLRVLKKMVIDTT